MKKYLFLILLLIPISIKAITNIEIDNNYLIPKFNNINKVYNYFTDNQSIKLMVDNEYKTYNLVDGKNKIIIDDYIINVYKNYKESEELYLEDLIIDGYNIDFNKDKYEYSININDEDYLNIRYVLSNYKVNNVKIIGNGNFNKTDNIIQIIVGSNKYIIHVYKSIKVSYVLNSNVYKTISNKEKEIVKIIIITISCILFLMFYKLLFSSRRQRMFY